MTSRRALSALVALTLVAALTACFPQLPGMGGTGGTTGGGDTTTGEVVEELVNTTWSGTDSDGDDWGFEFQSDGTVGLTFNGSSYDDDTDTWGLSGTTLRIHTVFVDGDYDFEGTYSGVDTVDLDGRWSGGSFSLTISRD
jgi:hypothetical protein